MTFDRLAHLKTCPKNHALLTLALNIKRPYDIKDN